MSNSRSPMLNITPGSLFILQEALLNTTGTVSLAHRFRALFTLKSFGKSTLADAAIKIISQGFRDPSALLKHELAYVLGQMGDLRAVPVLEHVLCDMHQDAMVRHEAAEALGALSSTVSKPILKRFLSDEERCVRETCEIALARIEWSQSQSQEETKQHSKDEDIDTPQFTSIDPAPPSSTKPSASDIDSLRTALTSKSLPLFERYRAMFALRNIAGSRRPESEKAAVDALSTGFGDDSELFKHEIAFVFGQLSTPHSIPALLRVLCDDGESSMVRHEAAEALGGIVGELPRDPNTEPVDVLSILKEWSHREDAPQVVRESCIVAVDMWEYENSNEFQYANGLESVASTACKWQNVIKLDTSVASQERGDFPSTTVCV